MKIFITMQGKLRLAGMLFGAFALSAQSVPALAQTVVCPAGYGYSYGVGCVPVAPAYTTIYPAPVVVAPPPVYDTFGVTFGFDDHHHHDHPHPQPHPHPQDFHRH